MGQAAVATAAGFAFFCFRLAVIPPTVYVCVPTNSSLGAPPPPRPFSSPHPSSMFFGPDPPVSLPQVDELGAAYPGSSAAAAVKEARQQ